MPFLDIYPCPPSLLIETDTCLKLAGTYYLTKFQILQLSVIQHFSLFVLYLKCSNLKRKIYQYSSQKLHVDLRILVGTR